MRILRKAISGIDFYQENGYDHQCEDFLTPDELETWRRQVDDAVAQRAGRITAGGKRSSEIVTDEESSYWDKVFVHRQNLWRITKACAG